jgi:alkylation response protein AidB-like acyl-CoA dehydrogenase
MFAKSPQSSYEVADDLVAWLRSYASTRINSQVIDERRTIPPHVVLDFGGRGLFGLQAPKPYGGLELAHTDTLRVLEQLGAIDLTLATFVSSHANGLHTIQHYGSPALRASRLKELATGRVISAFALTEPDAGSNPRAMRTTAVPDRCGGWRISGEKSLVDSGSWAGVFTVFAQTCDAQGRPLGISAFAVAQGAAGLTVGHESPTMGLRAMVQNAIGLHDVQVAGDAVLGDIGAGAAISQHTLSIARLNLAAKSLGATKRCLQLLHRFARRRSIATGLLWDNPVTQARAVRLSYATEVIESLVYALARRLDSGGVVPTEAFLACKVAASECLWKAIHVLTQALGGRGYEESNGVPQMLRDARSFLVSEGPSEVLLMYLGSRLIHAGAEFARFIAEDLGAPGVAARRRCRPGRAAPLRRRPPPWDRRHGRARRLGRLSHRRRRGLGLVVRCSEGERLGRRSTRKSLGRTRVGAAYRLGVAGPGRRLGDRTETRCRGDHRAVRAIDRRRATEPARAPYRPGSAAAPEYRPDLTASDCRRRT